MSIAYFKEKLVIFSKQFLLVIFSALFEVIVPILFKTYLIFYLWKIIEHDKLVDCSPTLFSSFAIAMFLDSLPFLTKSFTTISFSNSNSNGDENV